MGYSQDDVIQHFVDCRNKFVDSKYVITRYPDQHNRNSKDVDAYAEAPSGPPLAIEHTRLYTYRQQSRNSAWFEQSVAPLEKEAGDRYHPWRVYVTFESVRNGQAWEKDLVPRMLKWLDENLPAIEPSDHNGLAPPKIDIDGVGRVQVEKEGPCTTGTGLFVTRTVPPNIQFRDEALRMMTKAFDDKEPKLAVYREKGAISVLVLDTRDITTHYSTHYEAFLRACQQTSRPGIDEIWHARVRDMVNEDSYMRFLCFRGDAGLMQRANTHARTLARCALAGCDREEGRRQ